ncbi:MAG: Zn-ribbon domain-containing OB-fold protein [Deltaproteobacteria bacterium]|nr:Zn-ribbon domain-containing OB-fold protein [Deltaproteobacteria bacterium]
MPFKWAIGIESSKFFQEIRDREVLVGIKCQSCGRVYVPPRMVCGPCFVKLYDIVELGNEGVVKAVTLVNYPFIDPDTGTRRPVPYDYGYIQLDGADNLFSHVVRTKAGQSVEVGDRVRAVFASVKKGNVQDIAYFELADSK